MSENSLIKNKKKIKFSESFYVNKEKIKKEEKVDILAEEARFILLDIYAIHHYTNYYFVWNPNKYREQKEKKEEGSNEDKDKLKEIEEQENEKKALTEYYENLFDNVLNKAFTYKSPKAVEEFKNRIYKGTWPSKITNLSILIDKKCENVGENEGSGENALCIIVRLFAFCLAIDKQFRNDEEKFIKYFKNIDVLYVEWIRETTSSILNYFKLKNVENIIKSLIEEFNELFDIIEKKYKAPIAGLLNKEKLKKQQKEDNLNKSPNAVLENKVKENEKQINLGGKKTKESDEVKIFNEDGNITWGNDNFLMNLDYYKFR
uniref:Uncharacterized protein n=1 Tax=Meloidogyne hapla TaxID=6305 RepID=A0A1I8B7R4_MELHA